ncbi:winged helix-turn-helix transcriptional regulator [Pedobacter steynii]|uniref:MarR family transcriptional regulator n=1 Tax=Pedobacter steynii TaxID=430522 RepID=A0A1D7QPC6_9SPHI|nr:helix-turn-helix domain-containing protein [Pedobacter steynii]AOM80514.1 MarR family transcriptional regulator [Pedobacter steynii]
MKDFIHQNKIYYSPVEFAMAHIGGVWKMPIILCLGTQALRYGELKERIKHISDKMLITQLRELEERGMLSRTAYREKPPRVDYQLTERGVQALPVIHQLHKYGQTLMQLEGINT